MESHGNRDGTGRSDKKVAVTGFKQTLQVCIEQGNINGYHLDYFGSGPRSMQMLAETPAPYFRSCYDELYLYMQNTLTVDDLWIEPIDPA